MHLVAKQATRLKPDTIAQGLSLSPKLVNQIQTLSVRGFALLSPAPVLTITTKSQFIVECITQSSFEPQKDQGEWGRPKLF